MFNKEEFRDLLIKARGKRTNEEYAKESGVSRPYISAYLNLKRTEAPSPEVIKRLAGAARNGVKYEDFMKAAGYLEKISNESCQFAPVYDDKIDLVMLAFITLLSCGIQPLSEVLRFHE